jgi:hypothetical protein
MTAMTQVVFEGRQAIYVGDRSGTHNPAMVLHPRRSQGFAMQSFSISSACRGDLVQGYGLRSGFSFLPTAPPLGNALEHTFERMV